MNDNEIIRRGRELLEPIAPPMPAINPEDPVIVALMAVVTRLEEQIVGLHVAIAAPRVRRPLRDAQGRIYEVRDTIEEY